MRSMMLTRAMTVVGLLMLAPAAWAQCTKDTDCKGDRICVNGMCADANTAAPAPLAPAPQPIAEPAPAYAAPAPQPYDQPAAQPYNPPPRPYQPYRPYAAPNARQSTGLAWKVRVALALNQWNSSDVDGNQYQDQGLGYAGDASVGLRINGNFALLAVVSGSNVGYSADTTGFSPSGRTMMWGGGIQWSSPWNPNWTGFAGLGPGYTWFSIPDGSMGFAGKSLAMILRGDFHITDTFGLFVGYDGYFSSYNQIDNLLIGLSIHN